jgi:hypothetical protein
MAKEQPRNSEGQYYIKELRDEEGKKRLPVFVVEEIRKFCFKTDADKSQSKPQFLNAFQ